MRKTLVFFVALTLLGTLPSAIALDAADSSKTSFARGVATGTSWSVDYPDFAVALQEGEWVWILKGINGNTIGSGDSADILLTDANGKEVLNEFGYASKDNGTIEFSDYVSRSDFASIDTTRPFKGTIKVTRGFSSTLKDASITVTIPVTGFPKRPVTATDYIAFQTSFTPVPYPQNCTQTEFQYTVNDPYDDISTINFVITDAKGKEVGTSFAFGSQTGLVKDDVQLCSYSLEGTVAPYTFTTKISFDSGTGKLALTQVINFPISSKKDEALAKASTMGDFCAKGSTSKVVATGAACPAGFKKVNFVVPDETAWNSLTRLPNSQKNRNYIIYACVAQFDANTGGSKFRGYASPVEQQYYFSNGVNAMFTGSAKQLLKLSEKSAFIAKVTVSGGVTYTTFGGKTSVPSLAIKQFQSIGSC